MNPPPRTQVIRDDVNKLLGAYGTTQFDYGTIISTPGNWTGNAADALVVLDKPVRRWGSDVFESSSIDWATFDLEPPDHPPQRDTKTLRNYQQTALDDVQAGFAEHDRGKPIMACGSGKTFTALRIAEATAGAGGSILFLTPSISLLSQSLIDWANDADLPFKFLAVCSDIRAGRRSADNEDISPYDLTEPASTDPITLVARFRIAHRDDDLMAVFSTYQSLDVVAQARQAGALPGVTSSSATKPTAPPASAPND